MIKESWHDGTSREKQGGRAVPAHRFPSKLFWFLHDARRLRGNIMWTLLMEHPHGASPALSKATSFGNQTAAITELPHDAIVFAARAFRK
jgi:hypothetical protein